MATRRSRIKAIVNVPARRPKASEESENSKINKSSNNCNVVNNLITPSDKTDQNRNSDKANSSVNENFSTSQENPESITCADNVSVDISNQKDSDGSGATDTHDGELQPNHVQSERIEFIEKTVENHDKQIDREKSSPVETCADISSDKVVANCSSSKVGLLHSPLKQRPRLFIRPSPKLVDGSGRRRYPSGSSGSRHKTLSESEEETKIVADDAPLSLSESLSRIPNSSHNKTANSQETVAANSQETNGGDARKNGPRSGRQRAKNKENRVCDSRRRLWQKMKKGNESVPLDRSRLTMFDYIYYNPVSNPMRSSSESSVISKDQDAEKRNDRDALAEELVDDPGEGGSLLSQQKEKDVENDDSGVPAPRVKVGPDGELILDEQSLVIETTGLKEGLKDLAEGPALIESSSFTNYATYRKRSKGHDWSDTETLRFYRALNIVGTDFSLMQSLLFNKRSRRDLKNKFKREERRNPSLIEKALRYPGVFSNAEELQSEFAQIEPQEQEKTEGKKCRGQKRVTKCAPKSAQPPAKKKKRGKHWLVDANVSQGEDSEDNSSIANELEKEVEENAEKVTDGGTAQVVFSVSSEEMMMASQEIVLTNDVSPPPSCGGKSEGGESDASESSEGGFLSRVLQPTRSGRIPKRREVKVLPNQRKTQIKKYVEPLKKDTKVEEILHSAKSLQTGYLETDPRDSEKNRRPTVSIEVRDCAPSNMDVSSVEPGSLVVIATTAPNDPSRKVYEVFMVAPQIQDPVLISQNVSIEEDIGLIKGENKIFPSIHSGEGVICPIEALESCSVDNNAGLQT